MSEPRVKKVALACDSCRRRKRKCDGRVPVCSLCEKGNIECVYDETQDQRRPAQKNYVAALEARVVLLESILKDAGASDAAGPSGTNAAQTEGDDSEPRVPEYAPLVQPNTQLNPNTEPTFVPTDDATTDVLKLMAQPQIEQGNTSIEELDLGMDGYEPGANLELEHRLLAQFWDWQRMHLPQVAPVPFLAAYAVFSEAAHPGEPIPPPPPPPPPNPFSGPTEIGVPRATDVQLTPDLAQFISPLLLDTMFAIAALFHGNAEVSDRFYERARQRLFEEVSKPRLATVQAASLMSTWELGHARPPASWTLNGVAVALCVRLGMNIDATPLLRSGAMSRRLFETRNFVFWATYNFDRFGATCMGLHPLMNRSIISTPRHSSLAAANVLKPAKEETSVTAGPGSSALASASQSLPLDRPTALDTGTTWWDPSTLGMGDVLIQAGWEALRDLLRMSDTLFDGIYAFNAPNRTPQEILELVTRNNLTIQRFLDDLPTWMRATGAIRMKINGLVYLHLFTHLTSILTCRPFLSPPASSEEVGSGVGNTGVSQPTSSSHIVRRYRTLAFRVARASALQIMSLVRHIPLSSPCVTLPYAIYSASTILLLSPEDPAAMDGVRTGVTCLDSMHETGYWVDSAKDGSDRIKALAARWSVVIGPGKRVLGPLALSGGLGPSGSGSQDNTHTGDGESVQRTQSAPSATGGAIITPGSQSGQVSAGMTRPSTSSGSSAQLLDVQTHTPFYPAPHAQTVSPNIRSLQRAQGYDDTSSRVHAPQAYSGDILVNPAQQYGGLPLQEIEIDAAIAQALEAFGSTQTHVHPPTQSYPTQHQSGGNAPVGTTETQHYDSSYQADHFSNQPGHSNSHLQSSQYVPPPQYARDPLEMRRRQQERQSQEDQGQFQQSQYLQQAQHHHPYIRQPKPTRKRQPMNHVAYAMSHAEPQHDLHIDHHHWHAVLPPTDPNLPFPPDPTACTDMAACFSHTVEHSHDPAFVNSMMDPYAGVSVDWLSDVGSSFPAMTFDTFYSPSQVDPGSGPAGPSTYMQGPGGNGGPGRYGYSGRPGM